jgi:glycine/D-amino acid oxidase-like deaminating enzyme
VNSINRRAFLHVAGASALVAASGCAARRFDVVSALPRRFARVRVSPGRVIRTVVGLRPYRPSGFVLRAERIGDKLVVHNYGHGGGGVTLSWGTARLAVDELSGWTGGLDRAAVIGCGAIGLATARLLQRRGLPVTIYAKDVPPNTTSNVAGAQFGPFSVFQTGKTTAAFDDQFARAGRLSRRLFQDLPLRDFGIRWIENFALSDEERRPPPNLDLYPDTTDLGPREHPFPYRYARRFTTMLIETSTYMRAMLQEFLIAGGKVVALEARDRQALIALDEPVVFNCTGLGARALLGDEELTPAKGQVTFLLPQPEIDYITLSPNGLYMFPRSDGILLGGTFERGNWSLDPDPAAMARILDGHQRFFAGMT